MYFFYIYEHIDTYACIVFPPVLGKFIFPQNRSLKAPSLSHGDGFWTYEL
jgi:hypothetical protein